jgi:hypothetical protein
MRRVVDEAKRRLWRERLARFAGSGQSVAAFCSAERVSVPSFYEWKRKLASRSVGCRRRRTNGLGSGSSAQAFLPVRIEGMAVVQLELSNGTRVRVPSTDLEALRAAIAAAGRVPVAGEAEGASC